MHLTAAFLMRIATLLLCRLWSVSRIPPVAKPFWSLCGIDTLNIASSPLRGGLGNAALQRLLRLGLRDSNHTAPFLSVFGDPDCKRSGLPLTCLIMPNFGPQAVVRS